MTFIPNKTTSTVGARVKLNRDIQMWHGTFTKGHVFTVVSVGVRGPDLKDDDGRELLEMGLDMDALEVVE